MGYGRVPFLYEPKNYSRLQKEGYFLFSLYVSGKSIYDGSHITGIAGIADSSICENIFKKIK